MTSADCGSPLFVWQTPSPLSRGLTWHAREAPFLPVRAVDFAFCDPGIVHRKHSQISLTTLYPVICLHIRIQFGEVRFTWQCPRYLPKLDSQALRPAGTLGFQAVSYQKGQTSTRFLPGLCRSRTGSRRQMGGSRRAQHEPLDSGVSFIFPAPAPCLVCKQPCAC